MNPNIPALLVYDMNIVDHLQLYHGHIIQSPHALPLMNNTMLHINHLLSIPILLLETLPKREWSQVLEQRTQSEKWLPWCYTHYRRQLAS